jgi:predicted nucleic acid-binding protein
MGKSAGGVVVDSHLWIEFLSGKKDNDTLEVGRLIRARSVALAGPILYEVLVGPRSEGERQYLQGRLRAFPMLAATDTVWLRAVELGRLPGVAVQRVPFSDVLIAAHAEIHGLGVFTNDPHFDVFPRLKRHRR